MLWARHGSWEKEIIAEEEGVGARESGYGYSWRKHLRKVGGEGSDGARQVLYVQRVERSTAEGLAG